jgi:predicted metal-binding protein
MRKELDEEIQRLSHLSAEQGALAVPISTQNIVVADWVRFKCRYGCKGFGKHMGCPPYGPSVEETRRMVAEYETGLLLRFDGIPGHQGLKPEEIPEDFHPFYCEHQHCVAEEMEGVVDESLRRKCRHLDLVRPTMEGAGIDVFATAGRVGWEMRTVPCRDLEYGKIVHGNIISVGLILLE